MDNLGEEIEARIKKNGELIAEARQTIEKMRALFRSMGADLDSGDNVFLRSKELSPEGRKQVEEIVAKLDAEYEERYQQYLATLRILPGEDGQRPATLKQAMEESQRAYNEARARELSPQKRCVKRMRL